jgi:predicted CXXCH cytochrome family protein
MKTRLHAILAVLACLALGLRPASAGAIDAPHDGSYTTGNCDACHQLHNAAGGTLTNQADNNSVCAVCHAGVTPGGRLGFPWSANDQAKPGVGGTHHRWDALAASPAFGARVPAHVDMARRVLDGKLQCSTCHDQHAAAQANDPSSQHTSVATGVALAASGGATVGTPTRLTLLLPNALASPKGYRVKIARFNAPNYEVVISNNATSATPVWYFWNGTAWVVGNDTNNPTATLRTGSPTFALDDGTNVQVQLTGGVTGAGAYWDFYVSYPFLRATNVSDAMCLDCHAARLQSFSDVRGANPALQPNNGTTLFSHPVNQGLNANAKAYDRAAPLDANGALQTDVVNRDALSSNNLALDGNLVRCTTCHAVHNADSNSLTEDVR